MVVNAVGEVGNLVAYGYAEASVVTPIGAVGVIASCIIATYVLKEPFTRMHSLGILLVTAGVVLIVYAKGNEKVMCARVCARVCIVCIYIHAHKHTRARTHTHTHTHIKTNARGLNR